MVKYFIKVDVGLMSFVLPGRMMLKYVKMASKGYQKLRIEPMDVSATAVDDMELLYLVRPAANFTITPVPWRMEDF